MTPDQGAGAPDSPRTDGTSLFAAIEEQLGLRLDVQRAPVDVIVIESAERPDLRGHREPEQRPCVLAFSWRCAMAITRRDWWAGIAVVTAALLLNSVEGLYSVSWIYWLTH